MDATTKIAVILTAFDKMSPIINQATESAEKKMNRLMQKNFVEGGAMIAAGLGLIKKIEGPAVSAYAKLEDANTDLMASMMDATGAIDSNFQKSAALAESLGDKLPGTTADFYTLFKTMMENGVKSQNILNGVGKAAAYLAVDLKMPYAAAGEFAARMKEATGVADEEMLKFLDTVSRLNSLGIGADEMRFAFSRSSGSLKLLGLQGLQASNDMGVLYAQMIRIGGMSGETAGTSFNNIIQSLLDKKKFAAVNDEAKRLGVNLQFFKDGKFLGVENMVAQFDKLSKFDVNKRSGIVQLLTGGGQDAQAVNTMISQGAAGFAKLRAEMEKKAGLNDKVNVKLKTLNQIWEATTGTIENMLAALGAGLAPVLKPIVEMIGSIAAKIKEWLSNNPALAKFISMMIAGVGIALTMAGIVKIIQGIRLAMQLLNITMSANPFILIATVAILAISLIYANWGKIKDWFGRLWQGVKDVFNTAWKWIRRIFWDNSPMNLIYKNWDKIKSFFSGLWNGVISIFVQSWEQIKGNAMVVWEAIKLIVVSPIEWIKKKWTELKNWFKELWEDIKGFFSGAWDWITGKSDDAVNKITASPVNQVVENMKKDQAKLDAQMKAVGKTVDDYLPHSPAKKGPLMRLNKVRIVETLADTIKPYPLVSKMNSVASMAWGVASSKPSGVPAFAAANPAAANNRINFEINLQGGATKDDAKRVMDEIERRFPQLLKKYQGQQARVSF